MYTSIIQAKDTFMHIKVSLHFSLLQQGKQSDQLSKIKNNIIALQ